MSHYARSLAEHGKVFWKQVHFYLWDILHNLIFAFVQVCVNKLLVIFVSAEIKL